MFLVFLYLQQHSDEYNGLSTDSQDLINALNKTLTGKDLRNLYQAILKRLSEGPKQDFDKQ